MASTHRRRVFIWLLAVIVTLAVIALVGAYLAANKVRSVAQGWLGDQGRAAEISVNWNRVLLTDVVIDSPKGWPSKQSLRAKTVDIRPKWAALFSKKVEISAIAIRDYTLTVYRKPSGGIDVLPSLHERAKSRAERREGKKFESNIELLEFRDGTIDFYDGQISKPAHHIPITNAQAQIGPMHFPGNGRRTEISITGDFPGNPGGSMSNKGWIAIASRDADIETLLNQIPVTHIAPYLQNGSKVGFDGGRVGLKLKTRLAKQQINAQGRLTLSDLKLAEGGLLSLPRRAAIAALEDNEGRAEFDFTLSGPLSKPNFKMDDNLSMRVAGGLAGVFGISIEGLVGGIGHTVEDIGSALGNLTDSLSD